MAKTIGKYICEICNKEGRNKEEIEKHENMPLKGLNLKLNQIFKFLPRSNKEELGVIMINYKEIEEIEHLCAYGGYVYTIPLNNDIKPYYYINDWSVCDPNLISNLTKSEYELVLKKLPDDIQGIIKKDDLFWGVVKIYH
jgi:hypothetical protein